MKIDLSKTSWQYTALFVMATFWGSAFLLIKKSVAVFSGIQVAALRIAIAGVILLPLAIKSLHKINRSNIKSLIIYSTLGTFVPAICFAVAQANKLDSSQAGIINSLTPLFTLASGVLLYKKSVIPKSIVGVAFGLVGAIGLISGGFHVNIHNFNYASLIALGGPLCYGINSNEVKRIKNLNGIEISALALLLALPVTVTILFSTGFHHIVFLPENRNTLLTVALLSLLANVIGLAIFNTVIQHVSSVFASSVTYIVPVFAIFFGLIDGEILTPQHFLYFFIILIGVYLVNSKPKKS